MLLVQHIYVAIATCFARRHTLGNSYVEILRAANASAQGDKYA